MSAVSRRGSVKRSVMKPPCQGLADPRSNDCYGHGSLYKLWHYLKPYHPDMLGGTSNMSNKWFMVYFTVLAWAVVVVVGLGSELTVGCAPRGASNLRLTIARALASSPENDALSVRVRPTRGSSAHVHARTKWLVAEAHSRVSALPHILRRHTLMTFIVSHESGTVIWHLAQMSFSLMLAVAFTASGGYGMPFLAIGLWKCECHTLTLVSRSFYTTHLEHLSLHSLYVLSIYARLLYPLVHRLHRLVPRVLPNSRAPL